VKLRTVFDSNIYVAAALRPGQYADRWLDIATLPSSGLMLYVSAEILAEVQHKLIDRFDFTEPEVKRLTSRIKLAANMVKPTSKLNVIPDDPDDNVIVECAVAANAHLIVSADHHLLKLESYKGIGITHPRELKRIFATDFIEAD
jgi:putative PIN family toxin of toxin-antitoxin system